MAVRHYSNTATEAALASSIAAADTSLTVSAFTGYPAAPFTIAIERDTSNEEILLVTSVSGSTLTVSRAYDGTIARSHSAGAPVLHVTVAGDFAEANAHVNQASGVHGVSGALVGVTDVQTLTNKTLAAPTLTGTTQAASASLSGALTVAGTSTLGAVNAASMAVTGNETVGGTLTVGDSLTVTGTVSGAVPTADGHLAQRKTVTDGDAATLVSAKAYTDGKLLPASMSTGFYFYGSTSVAHLATYYMQPGTVVNAVDPTYFTQSGSTFTCVKAGIYAITAQASSDLAAAGGALCGVDVTGGINNGCLERGPRATGYPGAGTLAHMAAWVGYIGAGGTFRGRISQFNVDGSNLTIDYSLTAQLLVP